MFPDNSYDYNAKKTVAVLSANLQPGVAMNVLGHLAISIGAYGDKELMGRPQLVDASGVTHIGISRYPVIVTKSKPALLRRLVTEARLESAILVVDYPEQMLDTGHDDELCAALAKVEETDINYLGAILYGESEVIGKLTKKFSLWK